MKNRIIIMIITVLLVVAGIFLPLKEGFPGMYALIGLASVFILYGVAAVAGRYWLDRKEDYYEAGDDDD